MIFLKIIILSDMNQINDALSYATSLVNLRTTSDDKSDIKFIEGRIFLSSVICTIRKIVIQIDKFKLEALIRNLFQLEFNLKPKIKNKRP